MHHLFLMIVLVPGFSLLEDAPAQIAGGLVISPKDKSLDPYYFMGTDSWVRTSTVFYIIRTPQLSQKEFSKSNVASSEGHAVPRLGLLITQAPLKGRTPIIDMWMKMSLFAVVVKDLSVNFTVHQTRIGIFDDAG